MENWFTWIIIFIFGLSVGSFLNCFAYRITQKAGWFKKFISGRSFCPKCKHKLDTKDLIPLVSFTWLRGKCRYCKKKISWQYPLVELITAAIFTFIFYQQGGDLSALFGIGATVDWLIWRNWFIAAVLLIVFIVDYKEMIIPDKVILPAGIIIFIVNILLGVSWYEMILAGVAIGGFFLIQYLISNGKWIGFGDVKFGLVLGLFFGWWGLLALLLSYLIGGLVAVILLAQGARGRKSKIAFGPFLVIASFLVLFWGPTIWKMYKSIMFI